MLFALAFGLFGLVVGSFLNVVILRHGVRSLSGRSGCMSCTAQLPWYDLVPVLSWIALRGRCRACRARISVQYPLLEGATGVLFAGIGFWAGTLSFGAPWFDIARIFASLGIIALLVCIAAYDILHMIIPDEWAYAFAALAFFSELLSLTFIYSPEPLDWWWFLCAGPIAAAPLFALWLFSGGRWMGLGDAKLALGIGWLLGPTLGLVAVFGAFVLGAMISLALVFFSSTMWKRCIEMFTPTLISRRLVGGFTMKSEIPFGPFLILSCIIIWFASTMYGVDPLEVIAPLLLLNYWQ